MLEINARPVRDLRALIDLIGKPRVLRELNIHRTTLSRWLDESVQIPGSRHLAIKGLLGDLPGTAGRWNGWRFHDGALCSPAGESFAPGEVLSLILLRQQLTAQRREIDQLRVRCAVLEQGLRNAYPAANDERAIG